MIEAAYPEIAVYRFDLLALSDEVLENPAAFGITNTTDRACPGCGGGIPAPGAEETVVPNPDEYVYWDNLHFTATVHAIFGSGAVESVTGGE